MISFCTWIRDRFHQFEQVYKLNLARMRPQDEWIILDLESTDGMHQWGQGKLDQRIRYVREPAGEMHFAKLYNRSHRPACGQIIVTLDADNYIGKLFCQWAENTCRGKQFGHSWSNDWLDGTYGRVSVTKDLFETIGGYDESLAPVGCQDSDYIRRGTTAGYRVVTTSRASICGGAIPNLREDTMQHLGGSVQVYDQYNAENHYTLQQNASKGIFKANVSAQSTGKNDTASTAVAPAIAVAALPADDR